MNFSQNFLHGKIDLRLVLIVTLLGSVITFGEGHPTGTQRVPRKKTPLQAKQRPPHPRRPKQIKRQSPQPNEGVLNQKIHQHFQQEDFEPLEQENRLPKFVASSRWKHPVLRKYKMLCPLPDITNPLRPGSGTMRPVRQLALINKKTASK